MMPALPWTAFGVRLAVSQTERDLYGRKVADRHIADIAMAEVIEERLHRWVDLDAERCGITPSTRTDKETQ
jgi:uncharacterized OsmC-like protein